MSSLFIVFISSYSLFCLPVIGLECYCSYHCPHNSKNDTCHTEYQCFTTLEYIEGTKTKEYRYGCMPPEFEGGIFQCRQKQMQHTIPMVLKCCSGQARCNENLILEIPIDEQEKYEETFDKPNNHFVANQEIALVVSVTLSVVVFAMFAAYIYIRYMKLKKQQQSDSDRQTMLHPGIEPVGFMGDSHSSNSTGSQPKAQLTQRSIARQISIVDEVGRGRFSVVYIGEWREQVVAVKIFDVVDECSWQREQHFYKTGYLCHENILSFIGADVVERSTVDRLLITQYHAFGALHNFLQKHSFDYSILFRLIYSSLCGLQYLHNPINGSHGKPAIAHRDISSKNILVKNNLQCCISDLALAIEENPDEINQVPPNAKLPNPRYMAPEVLENPYCSNQTFSFYQKADMYSFSLVMWEILLRYEIEGVAEDYRLPFEEYVGINPTLDEMNDVIRVKRLTPSIPQKYIDDQNARNILKPMNKCMQYLASSRLSSFRLKKDLNKCMQEKSAPIQSEDNSNNTCSTTVT